MWFETLTGFHEQSPERVRNNISVNGEVMKSYVNGKEFVACKGNLNIRIHRDITGDRWGLGWGKYS